MQTCIARTPSTPELHSRAGFMWAALCALLMVEEYGFRDPSAAVALENIAFTHTVRAMQVTITPAA